MEPFWREDGGEEAGGAGDGGGETSSAEGGTVNEEVELVGGFAAIGTGVERDSEDIVVDGGRGNDNAFQRATADDDAREVDLAVGVEAVFVEVTEYGVGAVVLPDGMPMESDEMGSLHIRREF